MKKPWIILLLVTCLLGTTLPFLRRPLTGTENTVPCQPGLKETNCIHDAILHISTNITMDPATPPGAPYDSIVCVGETVTATSGGYSVISNAVQQIVQTYTGTGPCPPDITNQTLVPTATLGWTILYDNEDFDFGTGPSTGAFSYDIATAGTVTFNFHQIVMPTNSVCGAYVPEGHDTATKTFAFVEAEILTPNGRFIDGVDEAPTYRYDYQGVCLNSGHPQGVAILGAIQPDGMIFNWTLDPEAGDLTGATSEEPWHIPPDEAGAGTLTLKAAYTYTGGTHVLDCSAKTTGILIYDDHLARDMANFQVGTTCTNFTMPNGSRPISFNCHASTVHTSDGGWIWDWRDAYDYFIGWEVVFASPITTYGLSLPPLERGDKVFYMTMTTDHNGRPIMQHSQTVMSGISTWGANNEPITYTPGDPVPGETWKFALSDVGTYPLAALNWSGGWAIIILREP
jgi:hypothetical protein